MYHDGCAVADVIVAPDFLKELLFGKYDVGVLGKEFEKFEFTVWKADFGFSFVCFPAVDQDA